MKIMTTKDYGNVQEPDEELRDALAIRHSEGAGSLDANLNMLRFIGVNIETQMTVLGKISTTRSWDRALLLARMRTTTTVTSFAGIGIFFPDVMVGVLLRNMATDDTDRVSTMTLCNGTGLDYADLSTEAEFTDATGLLKMQIDISKGLSAKSLPTTRLLVSTAWDGVTMQTRLAVDLGRAVMLGDAYVFVLTSDDEASLHLDRWVALLDSKSYGIGELEAI